VIKESKTSIELLTLLNKAEINRKAEEGAIQLYMQIIDVAKKQGDEITTKLFQQILSEEENHLRTFKDMLE
jgi:bacterioferritin (cytochrome b1)